MTSPRSKLRQLAQKIYDFEAEASRRNTGTGSRREGDQFEELVLDFWETLAEYAQERDVQRTTLRRPPGKGAWTRLDCEGRTLYLPAGSAQGSGTVSRKDSRWLDLSYSVSDLIDCFPGTEEAVASYSPDVGVYSGDAYPRIYERRTTTFDGAIVLLDEDVLLEKILLEYKTAKSTKGRSVDGNAHERLSFQILQYLEVATRYSSCSLAVIANGAFTKYKNKYHPNFHVQANRLRVFRWFDMEYLTTVSEYMKFALNLGTWLLSGESRRKP